MPNEKRTRREFLETGGLAAGAVAALPACRCRDRGEGREGGAMPHRTLGRTGASVSILALGCGSRFLMYPEEQASAVLEQAIASGSTTSTPRSTTATARARRGWAAAGHAPQGRLPRHQGPRPLAHARRGAEGGRGEPEAAADRPLDLLHLHSLGDEADLAKIEAKDGAIKALYELREQKVARFIGMTSHTDGAVMAKAIERNDLDCVQMAMNPARARASRSWRSPRPTRRTSA